LNAPRGGNPDALVDRQCLLQEHRGLAGVAVVEVTVADTFQSAGFLAGGSDVAGHSQRLGVLITRPTAR